MRAIVAGMIAAAALASPIAAAEPSNFEKTLLDRLVYSETFDKPSRAAFGGAATTGVDGPWTVVIDKGVLSYSNTTDNSALRYVSIDSVLFGGARTPSDGSAPSAMIKVDTQDGGAGLLAGYARGGDYLVFALSARNQYSIMEKVDGKLSQLAQAQSDAIHPGEFNALAFTQDTSGHFRFAINGAPVFEIDRPKLARVPVGLAVYGRGNYLFDRYDIRPAPSLLDVLRRQAALCTLPSIASEDAVVMANIHRAAALSSVSLAGQNGQTHALTINVQASSQPVFLIALQDRNPTVWRFAGATERVAGVLIFRENGVPSGVAGVDRKLVAFQPPGRCFWHLDDQKYQAAAYVTASLALGRPLASLISSQAEISAVSIPDGKMFDQNDGGVTFGLPDHANTALLEEALRFDPAGVVRLSAADVVSDGPVEDYEVLPGQWGLLQLMAEGKIVAENRDATDYRMRFRIVAPMRFPAGLAGSQQVVFLLPKGVPMPAGDPGHSPVIQLDQWVSWESLAR